MGTCSSVYCRQIPDPRAHIKIGTSLRTDIDEIYMRLPAKCTVGAVKVRLAEILGVDSF